MNAYYIATGAQGRMYTLRVSGLRPYTHGPNAYGKYDQTFLPFDEYIQNLSTDLETARDKARKLTGQDVEVDAPTQLETILRADAIRDNELWRDSPYRGLHISEVLETAGLDTMVEWLFRQREISPLADAAYELIVGDITAENVKLHFGKFKGQSVQRIFEANPGYIVWLLQPSQYDNPYQDRILNRFFEEEIAKIDAERDSGRAKNCDTFQPIIDVLSPFAPNSSFIDSMVKKMRLGQTPSENQQEIICEIYAKKHKNGGKRNSKKYKAAFEAAIAIFEQ